MGRIAGNGTQMAGLIEAVFFSVHKAVGIHLNPHKRQEIRIVQLTVIHQNIMIRVGDHTVTVGFVVVFDLLRSQPPVRTGGVAMQVCFIRVVLTAKQFNAFHKTVLSAANNPQAANPAPRSDQTGHLLRGAVL